MKRKTIVSLMLAFFFATTFSSSLGYTISYYVNIVSISTETLSDQKNIASHFVYAYNNTTFETEEICEMLSTSLYKVQVLSAQECSEIPPKVLERIQSGEFVSQTGKWRFMPSCMFMAGNEIISININTHSNLVTAFGSRIGFILSLSILLSFVIMLIASRSIIKPIMQINAATKKVAKGDFDIHIDVEEGSKNEVAQLARSFNSMVEELKGNEILKKDFISNVSHEMKTPLATVNGFAKLLKDGNCTEEETKEYIEIIESETERLSLLCSNILRLSKIENQKIHTNCKSFSIDEQIRETIVALEPHWSEKNIDFDIELDEAQYYADEELMHLVWMNLITNAIKFSNQDGKVFVHLTNTPEAITVVVKDEGIGMNEDVLSRIFEKFYQGDKSRSTHGNGLGLPLVKEILTLHSCAIKVTSHEGEGSRFEVTLPKQS